MWFLVRVGGCEGLVARVSARLEHRLTVRLPWMEHLLNTLKQLILKTVPKL